MTTIADKRAQLYREWFLATLSNDENYYFSTLALGVPDGDTEQDLLWDLEGGWYDKDIDDTINVYLNAKKCYGEGGYFVNGEVIMDEDMALYEAGYDDLPKKIYKRHTIQN